MKELKGAHLIDRALLNIPTRLRQEKAHATELKMCVFAVEHNLPFLIFEHLPKFIASLPEKDILKTVQCSRMKATSLINDKLGPFAEVSLAAVLKKTLFSVIIDETTDISAKKCLVIIVRYYCEQELRVVDAFLA